MQHAPVVIYLISLISGIAVLGILFSRFRQTRSTRTTYPLQFFLSYSFLMGVAVVFAYLFVNVSYSDEYQILFASLVFGGIALLELTIPRMILLETDYVPGRLVRVMFLAGVGLTLSMSILVWFFPEFGTTIILFLAFLPFVAIVAFSFQKAVSHGRFKKPRRKKSLWFVPLYIIPCSLAVFEIVYLSGNTAVTFYLPLSLPIAYLLTSIHFLFMNPSVTSALELPESLVNSHDISAREAQIAGLILRGLSNKEIAWELKLSENTVRNHIYHLYQKLNIQKRMDLVSMIDMKKE